jgi:histidinol-phosphate aminotransferase
MSLFRPEVDRIAGYVPGEQPQESGWTKLNTNENPYPPSPRVVEAIRRAAEGRLNVYPDPLASEFRARAAALFGVDADWILPANGSDENLTILLRTFVSPGELVSYPYPSYTLYETLADIQGATRERLPLNGDWSWDFEATQSVVERSKLVFVPNPNSPSGNRWSDEDIRALMPPAGVLVLDEAYGDFCDEPHRGEMLQGDSGERIVITRTLSKSYSLAGMRLGFAVAHPDLIAGMRKVKDSYNCDAISLAAGVAALEDQEWMESNAQRIRATRGRLSEALGALGFDVVPSESNFVWCTRPAGGHRDVYEALKSRRILVRYMHFPEASGEGSEAVDGLRITVGTNAEIDRFIEVLGEVV